MLLPCGLCYCSRLRAYFRDVFRERYGVTPVPKKTAFSFAVTTCDRFSKHCVTAMRMTLFIVTWSRSAPSWLARKIPPRWSCAVSALPCNSRLRNLMALVCSYLLLIHLCFLYAIYFTWRRERFTLKVVRPQLWDARPPLLMILYQLPTKFYIRDTYDHYHIKITLLVWKMALSQRLLNTCLLNLVKSKKFGKKVVVSKILMLKINLENIEFKV